jgi:nucleotide-binding universal stress UspA family protein
MKTNTGSNGLIVVGVDSSEGAKAALRFALEEAKLRQATLRVVHTWQFGYIGVSGLEGFSPVLGADLGDLRRTAELALDAVLHEVAPGRNGVLVERHVVEGAPATVLVDESERADLLVVGSRGHGGFAGLLLGSVSQQCAHHAACPVVIVHASANAAA